MSKNRPQKHIRERSIKRCKNRNCRKILKDAEEILEGFCHNCSTQRKQRRKQ